MHLARGVALARHVHDGELEARGVYARPRVDFLDRILVENEVGRCDDRTKPSMPSENVNSSDEAS